MPACSRSNTVYSSLCLTSNVTHLNDLQHALFVMRTGEILHASADCGFDVQLMTGAAKQTLFVAAEHCNEATAASR